MSLVDRWLSRSLQEEGVATSATSATLRQDTSISADFSVATALRQAATLPIAPPALPPMSQPVAVGPRRENPQDAAALAPLSQMSLLSQDVAPDPSADAQKERIHRYRFAARVTELLEMAGFPNYRPRSSRSRGCGKACAQNGKHSIEHLPRCPVGMTSLAA
jgi:hypothetical protein